MEVTSLEFSPRGPFLLVGDIRGNITLFDLYQSKISNTFSRHSLTVTSLKSLREESSNFASGSLDSTVKVWDVQKKKETLSVKVED